MTGLLCTSCSALHAWSSKGCHGTYRHSCCTEARGLRPWKQVTSHQEEVSIGLRQVLLDSSISCSSIECHFFHVLLTTITLGIWLLWSWNNPGTQGNKKNIKNHSCRALRALPACALAWTGAELLTLVTGATKAVTCRQEGSAVRKCPELPTRPPFCQPMGTPRFLEQELVLNQKEAKKWRIANQPENHKTNCEVMHYCQNLCTLKACALLPNDLAWNRRKRRETSWNCSLSDDIKCDC